MYKMEANQGKSDIKLFILKENPLLYNENIYFFANVVEIRKCCELYIILKLQFYTYNPKLYFSNRENILLLKLTSI